MTFFSILILAVVQGAAELLPVSSSAHVIVAAKLLGLDPAAPEMTLLLVMLHTGTMFAVILFFWKAWRQTFFSSTQRFLAACKSILAATALTGAVGMGLKTVIERVAFGNAGHAEIEMLFGNLGLISAALLTVGVFIVYAGLRQQKAGSVAKEEIALRDACAIGAVQGFCLPFRGFSRSGATISAGLVLGLAKERVDQFSFALAVVLTPPIIAREVLRLLKAQVVPLASGGHLLSLFLPGLCGMALSFLSGLIALRWLSSWLERGLWHYFGYYCLAASLLVFVLYARGF